MLIKLRPLKLIAVAGLLSLSALSWANNPVCDSQQRCLTLSQTESYLEAIDHIEAERWAEAEVLLKVLYGANSQNLIVVNNYATVLARQNKMNDAAYVLENFLSNEPHTGTLFKNLVRSYEFLAGDSANATNGLSFITAYRPNYQNVSYTPNNVAGNMSEEARVRGRLDAFVAAWEAGDADAYLSFYWPEKSPLAGKTYEQWKQNRQQRVTPDKDIQIDVLRLRSEMLENGDFVTEFTQRYSSKGYSDKTKKRLVWRMHSKHWMIIEEASL